MAASPQQTTYSVQPDSPQAAARPVAGFTQLWYNAAGILVQAVVQALSIVDPATGLGVSVTALGTRGTNGAVVQGDPNAVPIPVSAATWKVAEITAENNTPVAASVFGGIYNPNVGTQNFEVTVNDNTTTNSGPQLYFAQAVAPSNPTPSPSTGVRLTSGGFVVNCAAVPAGVGLIALYLP